uniref:Elongation of very long chain fatty acids protein n=1 Tax=Syphacia muris TaxID=451379 RepID=A0A0N5A846_9BILA
MVIFGTKRFMRDRRPFDLHLPLNIWNALLAAFSIAGTMTLLPEFVSVVRAKGFIASYCNVYGFTRGAVGYWNWLFIISKLFELFDTVFIVLRKKPLMFLHWYHHVLTLFYAFYSYPRPTGFSRWGVNMNYFVHSFMYSYYFLRSMKMRLPGLFAKFITTLQIIQFVISVTHLMFLGYLFLQMRCDFDDNVFFLAAVMNLSYLILFINFFMHSYVIGGGKLKYRASTVAKKLE